MIEQQQQTKQQNVTCKNVFEGFFHHFMTNKIPI